MTVRAGCDSAREAFDQNADPEPAPSGELQRLILVSLIVGSLFFGGVYWLRLQVATGGGAPEMTVVQVHLLPSPDPIPVPVAPAPQTAASIPNPTNAPTETRAAIATRALAAASSETPAISEPAAAPSTNAPASADPVPNAATSEFRDALLRHIARFQRYPKAGERQRLQGTVRAVFSVSRDGKLLGAWVKTSSGETVLDQAALATLRRAQPLPVIPRGLPDPIKVELALGFDPP